MTFSSTEAGAADEAKCLSVGRLALDPRRHEVTFDGRSIALTPTEFRLLYVLARHPGWVCSCEELLEQVWGGSSYVDPGVVSVHVSRLRSKLKDDDPNRPSLVVSVRGVGYKLEPKAAANASARQAEVLNLPLVERGDQSVTEPSVPGQFTDFGGDSGLVGRAREMDALERLLRKEGARLITLTGTGGTGKTRLAAAVLPRLTDGFDAVFAVGLSALRDPELVASTIAQGVGLREVGERAPVERLRDFFREGRALLVLDNFEQVIAAAPLVGELLAHCAALHVLVTSRIPLHLRGEHEFAVEPLAVPGESEDQEAIAESPAVQLFTHRVRTVRRDFELTKDNAATVAAICRRLDGLPLALELAAARIKLLPLQTLLERLERPLPLLTGGPRDVPERQQTMRDTIAWSHGLLEEEAACLFRRLSVFVGGWSLEAAEAICNADSSFGPSILKELEGLVDQNLIASLEGIDGEPRFSMLETIREFAVERLAESEEAGEVTKAHAQFFLNLLTKAEPWLTSARRGEWLPRLELDLDNIRAALHRSLLGNVETRVGLDLLSRSLWFWYLRGRMAEGRSWAENMLAHPATRPRRLERAKTLAAAGALAWCQGDFQVAGKQLGEGIEIIRVLDQPTLLAFPLTMLGATLASQEDYAGARCRYEEAIECARSVGDRWVEAFASSWLADVQLLTGDLVAARRLQEQSLSLFEALGDFWGRAMVLHGLAVVLGYLGEFEPAHALFEESAAGMAAAGDQYALARVLSGAADLALRQGDEERARELLLEAIGQWRRMGNETGLRLCLGLLARLAAAQGRADLAACLLGAGGEPLRTVGSLSAPGDRAEYEQTVSELRAKLGEHGWTRAFGRGRAMRLHEAIELALDKP